MRKRRAIIVDDEAIVLNMLKMFLELRGYEVMACREAFRCEIYGDHAKCDNLQPCADVLITDNRMPKMSGIEMLEAQARMGCKLIPRNTVVISAYLDEREFKKIGELGCAFLEKPFTPDQMETWLVGCEERMDLTKPLGSRRKEQRESCSLGVSYRKEAADLVYAATTINRSGSGLCLKVEQAPVLYDVLTLMADLQLPSKKARVKWSAPAGDGGYYIGLSFC
jgi:CheY-like chemotaxis protein